MHLRMHFFFAFRCDFFRFVSHFFAFFLSYQQIYDNMSKFVLKNPSFSANILLKSAFLLDIIVDNEIFCRFFDKIRK